MQQPLLPQTSENIISSRKSAWLFSKITESGQDLIKSYFIFASALGASQWIDGNHPHIDPFTLYLITGAGWNFVDVFSILQSFHDLLNVNSTTTDRFFAWTNILISGLVMGGVTALTLFLINQNNNTVPTSTNELNGNALFASMLSFSASMAVSAAQSSGDIIIAQVEKKPIKFQQWVTLCAWNLAMFASLIAALSISNEYTNTTHTGETNTPVSTILFLLSSLCKLEELPYNNSPFFRKQVDTIAKNCSSSFWSKHQPYQITDRTEHENNKAQHATQDTHNTTPVFYSNSN